MERPIRVSITGRDRSTDYTPVVIEMIWSVVDLLQNSSEIGGQLNVDGDLHACIDGDPGD